MKSSGLLGRLRPTLCLLATLALLAPARVDARTWTNVNGSNSFEGQLVAYDPATGKVTVDRGNGKPITFSQELLSPGDIDFLKQTGKVEPPKKSSAKRGRSGGALNDVPDTLPDPDGKEADMSKPVKVFILMGQSNMLGFGKLDILKSACAAGKYPYVVDDSGNWTTRKDVRNIFIMNNGIRNDEWLTVPSVNNNVGVELAIGHYMGELYDAPVLILKSCIGNRSLGWDLLPPSVKAYEYEGKLHPGYGEDEANAGKGKNDGGWYAGTQWDTDISGAHSILKNIDKHYPGAKGYEVEGFFWWQGDKDMRNPAHFNNYERNLVALIKDLRKEFDAPNAAFVSASLGQTDESDNSSGHGIILQAMKTVASSKYKGELGDNIGFVYSKPHSLGGSSSGHYSNNAETYMNIGEAMGKEMVKQLTGK